MILRPRGGRVIIKPEQAADFDARSGLHLAKAWEPEQRGIVLAVQTENPLCAVQPGDDVLFSWQAGQELWIDEGRERLLILREEDLLAVVEP